MRRYHHYLLSAIALIGLLVSSCQRGKSRKKATAAQAAVQSTLNLRNFNTKVAPGDDFYTYVNGNWQKTAQIPADKGQWNNFQLVDRWNDTILFRILDGLSTAGKYKAGSEAYKVGTLYDSYLDIKARNRQGAAPIKPILKDIERIKNLKDLQGFVIRYQPYGIDGLYNFYIMPDMKNSARHAGWLARGSTGLRRGYYLDADKRDILNKYRQYIVKSFEALGDQKALAEQKAKSIIALETRMQRASLPKEALRNPHNIYNPMTVKALQQKSPLIDWQQFFKGIGAGQLDSVVVYDVGYIKAVSRILKTTPIIQLKRYLSWQVINDAMNSLSQNLYDLYFDFYGRTLKGIKRPPSVEKRALKVVNDNMGKALGRLYVAKVFPPAAKDSAKLMVRYIRRAFANRIENLNWMSQATKEQALKKLHKIRVKIGYPDRWKDYGKMRITSYADGGSLYQNLMNASHWRFEERISKLHKPVDRGEWMLNPQTINAYYNPANNEIVFPAAILQPPFYNYKADPAVNFGGIGGVIGHEVSHGFDDEGRNFDSDGNMKDWWRPVDAKKFKELTALLVKQYDRYEPLPGLHVNGEYTLGENIGDLGGVNVSYDALQLYLKEHPDEDKKYDGFTENQRFFLSWTTIWRVKYSDASLRALINTNPHAPSQYRAVAPLVNIDAFYKAFDIKPADSLYVAPKNRIRIW